MENHHSQCEKSLKQAMFNSYVELPRVTSPTEDSVEQTFAVGYSGCQELGFAIKHIFQWVSNGFYLVGPHYRYTQLYLRHRCTLENGMVCYLQPNIAVVGLESMTLPAVSSPLTTGA